MNEWIGSMVDRGEHLQNKEGHLVQIPNSYVDYTITIYCLRHPSGRPLDDT
jgi:hypothetical protein